MKAAGLRSALAGEGIDVALPEVTLDATTITVAAPVATPAPTPEPTPEPAEPSAKLDITPS